MYSHSAQRLEQFDGVFDVGDLLGAGDFAFDGHRPAEAEGFQLGDEHREVHPALAQRLFGAQAHPASGVVAVLGVEAADVLAEDVHGVKGIAPAVHE